MGKDGKKGGKGEITWYDDDYAGKKDSNITTLKKKKSLITTKRMAIVTCISIIVFAVWLNWDSLSPTAVVDAIQNFAGGFGESKYPVNVTQGSVKDAVALGENLGVLTDTSFLIYSPSGNQLAGRQHGFSDPEIVSGGGKAVIYDSGGKQLKVETRFDEAFTTMTNYAITTAAVSQSGIFAVVTGARGYLSEVDVYDRNCKKYFTWYSSQGRIISVALSPDGTSMAALATAAENGSIKSVLYVFNLDSNKPIEKSYKETFLFSVHYKGDNAIAAVGDNQSVFFDGGGNEISKYEYSDKTLKCYQNGDDSTVLAFSRYGIGRDTTLVSFDDHGKVRGQSDLSSEVKYLSADADMISVLTDGGLWNSTINCGSISKKQIPGDTIKLLAVKKNTYIFGLETVYQYKTK